MKKLFVIKTYQVQESKDPITEFHGYCSDMVISYYNDILYIYTEDGILERTEKDINLIEDGEFDYIDIPYGMKFPKWATYYLYNNSTEEFKKVVLEHSEFDIFS